MSKFDDRTRLRHMLSAASTAQAFVQGETRASLDNDPKLSLALVRLLEIVGEAASRITRETQLNTPAIPWQQMIAMRNRLIHAYFDINLDIVWQTVVEDLHPLTVALKQVLADLDEAN